MAQNGHKGERATAAIRLGSGPADRLNCLDTHWIGPGCLHMDLHALDLTARLDLYTSTPFFHLTF